MERFLFHPAPQIVNWVSFFVFRTLKIEELLCSKNLSSYFLRGRNPLPFVCLNPVHSSRLKIEGGYRFNDLRRRKSKTQDGRVYSNLLIEDRRAFGASSAESLRRVRAIHARQQENAHENPAMEKVPLRKRKREVPRVRIV